ncbi:DUF3089 domain-containing protein [soil metagenome]
MARLVGTRYRLVLACLAVAVPSAAMVGPSIASAEGTTWICKPGQSDDLCAGTIDGETMPPPGGTAQPLGYTRPAHPKIDCFYLYPTQSEQAGPNADLAKDPEIRRVVVQQARMFSSVCNVYAPMYRQVTLNGDQSSYNASVETAYQSAKSGFKNYLKKYNDGRGFIMIGHSQGSAHTARLIDEMVDKDPKLRKRFVGAIAPGANIPVPIGKSVGGLFDHVRACTKVGQDGCVTAFSTYNDVPGPSAEFSRVDAGYWIYPEPRFSSSDYEVMCTNPATLDGGDGGLLPLVNFDYLFDTPAEETEAPWRGQPEYYRAECTRNGGAHWLNLTNLNTPGDSRPDLGAIVASGSNYHVPEVNLTEGNLLTIAQLQTDSFRADVRAKLKSLRSKLVKTEKHRSAHQKQIKKLSKKLKKAHGHKQRQSLMRKLKKLRGTARDERREISSLRKDLAKLPKQLG